MIVSHASEGKVQRWVFGILGVVAAIVVTGGSMMMNWRFGNYLGRTPLDGMIYGSIGVAADVFVALSPFFFFAAVRNRELFRALAAGAVWLVAISFAVAGAFGHAALNRLDTAGHRTEAADSYKDLRSDLKRVKEQLAWVPQHRPADTVKADIEGAKANRWWSITSECSDPTGKTARTFCEGFHRLQAELAAAQKAEEHEKRVAELEDKIAKLGGDGAAATGTSDPQATVLSKLSGLRVDTIQAALAGLVVVLLVVGSACGPYAAMAMFPVQGPRPDLTPGAPKLPAGEAVAGLAPLGLPPPPPANVIDAEVENVAGSAAQNTGTPPAQQPVTLKRAPLPGSEVALDAIGFPLRGKPDGPLRPKQSPEEAANRFVVWLRAMDLVREPITETEIVRLYGEFCEADHRKPTGDNWMRGAMKELPVVSFTKARGDGKPSLYTISRGRYPKPQPPAEAKQEDPPPEPEAKPEGGRPLRLVRPLEREPRAWAHPAIKHAQAHWMRREGRNRKQRGSRMGRRAA
jgi:hypothetical protein